MGLSAFCCGFLGTSHHGYLKICKMLLLRPLPVTNIAPANGSFSFQDGLFQVLCQFQESTVIIISSIM